MTKTDHGLIAFGKFSGQRWDNVSKSYLEYLISEDCNTSETNKAVARQELRQRDIVPGQTDMFAAPAEEVKPERKKKADKDIEPLPECSNIDNVINSSTCPECSGLVVRGEDTSVFTCDECGAQYYFKNGELEKVEYPLRLFTSLKKFYWKQQGKSCPSKR